MKGRADQSPAAPGERGESGHEAPRKGWYYESEGGRRGPVAAETVPALLDYGIVEPWSVLRDEEGNERAAEEFLPEGIEPEPEPRRRGPSRFVGLLLVGAAVAAAFWYLWDWLFAR